MSEPIKKKIISHILEEDREWFDSREKKPNPNQRVIMRLWNPHIIYNETDTEIYPSEDAKIGRYVSGYKSIEGAWYVDPPFFRYDYSPLSNKEKLNPDTIVTHWAIPTEKELDAWDHMFEQINLFKKLNLEVDQEHEEDVYRALMFGSRYIQLCCQDDPEALRLATILYDLQYVIDTRKSIDLSDEEYANLLLERSKKENENSLEDKDDES